MFWDFLFYGIIAVGAILFVSLTIYRIDWARHPEKYKDIAGDFPATGCTWLCTPTPRPRGWKVCCAAPTSSTARAREPGW